MKGQIKMKILGKLEKGFLGDREINVMQREQLIHKEIKQLHPGENILDAGAGMLRYKKVCEEQSLKYISQDFCQYTGEGNGKGLQRGVWDTSSIDIVSDITEIPLKTETIDNILCSEVLEHIISPEMAIKEFARLLVSGGKLILSAPFCAGVHMAPYFYNTGFSRYWYEQILEKYGLHIEKMEYNGNWFSYVEQEIRRLSYMKEHYLSEKYSLVEWWRCNMMARTLYKLSRKTSRTEEFMCFGILIVAIKK